MLSFIFFGFSIVSSFSGYYYYLFCKIDIISLHCKWFLTFFYFPILSYIFLFLIDSPFIWILIAPCFEIIGDNYHWYTAKELLYKDDATLFDFFGLAPTTHHSPRLDALYFPTMPNALRKRGVTRKTLYSEYIKRYPQGYFYCSFNRFLRAYIASRKSLFKGFDTCGGSRKSLFKGFDACGPPANRFLKVLVLASLPQIIPQKVWHFRAWRKSFHESLDNLTPRDVYLGQGEKIKKIREIIK